MASDRALCAHWQVILINDNVGKTAPATVAVHPEVFDRVQQILDENGIHFVIVDSDLQA